MKRVQVYEPAMCCSTGVCGPSPDKIMRDFSGLVLQLKNGGIEVERYNLAQEPKKFVENPIVKEKLNELGEASLPIIFWDDSLKMTGSYPNQEQATEWINAMQLEG